jgi:hypothetical protein
VKHRECFASADEALAYGTSKNHTKCFYPRCRDQMAAGTQQMWDVLRHVQMKHGNGETGE